MSYFSAYVKCLCVWAGKRIETSLVMKRAPGVLTFLELGWNATIPDREPLQVSFHFREKAKASVYQVGRTLILLHPIFISKPVPTHTSP